MKALALLKRWGESRGNRRKQRGGWRSSAKSALHIEPLEERRMLSVSASLLADLNVGVDPSSASDFVEAGGTTFFVAEDSLKGRELWKTDGTTEGTELVKDIYESGYSYDVWDDDAQVFITISVPYSSDPQDLVVVNGMLYFTADHGVYGRELWMSDGTSEGTEMVVDLYEGTHVDDTEGTLPNSSDPQELLNMNGTLVFTATNGVDGRELWRSDGTADGTARIKDINPGDDAQADNGSSPEELTRIGGNVFFSADDGTSGRELWVSNGTEEGTVQVSDIVAGANGSDPASLTDFDGTLCFTADDGTHGVELWKTDGAAGVVQVEDIRAGGAGSDPTSLTVSNGILYFAANDGTTGAELWKSDGTAAGTELVADIQPGVNGSDPAWLTDVDGTLYFAANDGTTGTELWKTGSAIQVEDINPEGGSSNPSNLVNVDGTLYFSADDGVAGAEPWVSDGTSNGTFLLRDINPGAAGSDPTTLTNVNGTLFLSADDGVHNQEPWIHAPARMKIFVDGQEVAIPAYLGVGTDGNVSPVYSLDGSGTLLVSPVGDDPVPETVTMGDVFDTWKDNAGLAGNNPDAVFNEEHLLGNDVDATHKIQMFVNGVPNQEFEDYAIQGGDEIVIVYTSNEVVSLNTNVGSILIELLAGAAPGTVANFLDYANDGDWITTFVHRSMSNFVVQLGGFTTSSPYFYTQYQFSSVPTDPPIQNEFGISNTRGTIAMAKLGGDPDSATSQFFFNLGDNSANLDAQNGGFTVFARTLDMTVVDTIAAFATEDLDGDQATLYDDVPFTEGNELVVVESIGGEGVVQGTVFDDLNGDGDQDPGENGRAGVTIFIDEDDDGELDDGEFSTTSDANGGYSFRHQSGQYVLRQQLGPHRFQTSAADGYDLVVQMGRETASLDFGSLEALPPTGIDLVAATDSGAAANDDLTNFNNSSAELALQIYVTGGQTGAEIRVYADDVLIGSGYAASPVTVTTDGVTLLADGEHTLTATQVLHGFESAPSADLVVTIDTVPPAEFETDPPAPDVARPDELYVYDANSPGEGGEDGTISLFDAPAGMAVTQWGEVTWTPTAAQEGVHIFEIRITDDAGNYAAQPVVLTVLGDPPAYPDYYEVDEDDVLAPTAAEGVLANDGDGQAGLVGTVTLVTDVSHGTLDLNADGSFTYTPDPEFSGTDMFTYVANDGNGDSNEAPVTITVVQVNDPPVAVADSYDATEDTLLEVTVENGLLVNDSDIDSAAILANLVDDVDHGTLDFDNDGSFTYTPDEDYFGDDTFTYQATDGESLSDVVTVTITVAAVNDPPEVVDSEHTVAEDGELDVPANLGVLLNAVDAEGDFLTAVSASDPDHGELTLRVDGSFTYTPDDDFHGVDSFTFRASDGAEQSELGTVTINVQSQPDPPSAVDDEYGVIGGDPIVLHVLENDSTDPDEVQPITITNVTQGSEDGVITISADKTAVEYSPESAFSGTETFTYTIEDSDGLTSVATVTVTVTNWQGIISGFVYCDSNDDGVRGADEVGVGGAVITLTGVDDQDNVVEESTLTASDGSYSFDELAPGTYEVEERQPLALRDGQDTIGSLGGTVENDHFSEIVLTGQGESVDNNFGELGLASAYIRRDMFFASTPPPQEFLREVLARAEEEAGNTELATQIRDGAGDVPDVIDETATAVNDAYSVGADSVLSKNAAEGVLANDVDANGDPVDTSEFTLVLVDDTLHGDLALSPDGSFDYTPDAADFSYTDNFTYKLNDGTLDSNVATATITVNPTVVENTAPVAVGDGYSVDEDQQLLIDSTAGVLANDIDGEDDALTAAIASLPLHGDLSLGPNGSFIYIPHLNYSGADSFTYSANDGELDSNQTTVNILVGAVNDSPAAADDSYGTVQNGVLIRDAAAGVLDNDDDGDGSPPSPLTGLVITEVNYSPPDPTARELATDASFVSDDFEFIELKNVGEATIELGGVEFTEGVTFAFTGSDVTALAAGDTVLVVNDLSAFEARYGTGLNVAGEFDGTLDDVGERVRLEDALTSAIHDFLYDDDNGWPADAAGNGKTLAVVDVRGDYDDPANWIGSDPSPGTASNTAAAVDLLMAALLVDGPDHGDLTLGDDGSFTYTPDQDYFGFDSFTYRASDGTDVSDEATVTIEITPPGG